MYYSGRKCITYRAIDVDRYSSGDILNDFGESESVNSTQPSAPHAPNGAPHAPTSAPGAPNNIYDINNIKDTNIPPIPPNGGDAGVDPGADNFDPKSSIPDTSIPAPSTPPDPSLEYYDPEYGCRQEYKYHPIDGIDDNPNPNWYSETA